MSPGAGNIHLSRNQPELAPGPTCSGTIECALAGVADQVLLALWLLLLVIVAAASLLFLPRARSLCEREIKRTQEEFDAFDAFINQITAIPASVTVDTTNLATNQELLHHRTDGGSRSLTQVHNVYRDTVMAVPHFEEDYDESILDHMSAELNSEIAHATVNGAEFNPHLKQNLLDAAIEARDRRADFIATLNEENDALETYESRLEDMYPTIDQTVSPPCASQTFSELQYRYELLEEQEETLEQIAEDRQVGRKTGRIGAIHLGKDIDLQKYLYQPLDVDYPVLAEATQLLGKIRITTKRVEDELIYRG